MFILSLDQVATTNMDVVTETGCHLPLALRDERRHPIMLLATLGSVTLAWMSTLMSEGKLERKESGRPSSSSWKLSIIFYRDDRDGEVKLNNPTKNDIMMGKRWIKILLQRPWGPSHSRVWGTSPAWRESSSTCTCWRRAGRPQYRERNRRSLRRPRAQTRSLNSASGGRRPTCAHTGRKWSAVLRCTAGATCRPRFRCLRVVTCLLWDQDPHRRPGYPPFLHCTSLYIFDKSQAERKKTGAAVTWPIRTLDTRAKAKPRWWQRNGLVEIHNL